jgi:hypothetical protein
MDNRVGVELASTPAHQGGDELRPYAGQNRK